MARKMTHKQAMQILIDEHKRQTGENSRLLKEISQSPGAFGPILEIQPEPAPNFDEATPEETIYRELQKLNIRAFYFPPSAINQDYLRSALPVYDAIIPLIKDRGVKGIAQIFRDGLVEKLEMFEEYKSKRKHNP